MFDLMMAQGNIEIAPEMLIYVPAAAFVIQALRNIPVVEKASAALPFVSIVLGVIFAILAMPAGTEFKKLILAGVMFGASTSGIASVGKPLGLDKVGKINPTTRMMCLLLIVGLIAVMMIGGCGGQVQMTPTFQKLLIAWDVDARADAARAQDDPPPAVAGCYVGSIPCEVVREILILNAERVRMFRNAAENVRPEGGQVEPEGGDEQ